MNVRTVENMREKQTKRFTVRNISGTRLSKTAEFHEETVESDKSDTISKKMLDDALFA
ncbi:MAG: hypothetical protein ACI4OL_02455 [Gemmiger sp.]